MSSAISWRSRSISRSSARSRSSRLIGRASRPMRLPPRIVTAETSILSNERAVAQGGRKGHTMKATILAVALAAAVLAGSARAAVSVTAETAFLKAQTCLKAHGALSVSNVGLIGGSARFSAGAASWRYLVTKAYPLNQGKVLGVKSYAFSVSMKPGTRVIVRRCVVASTRG